MCYFNYENYVLLILLVSRLKMEQEKPEVIIIYLDNCGYWTSVPEGNIIYTKEPYSI